AMPHIAAAKPESAGPKNLLVFKPMLQIRRRSRGEQSRRMLWSSRRCLTSGGKAAPVDQSVAAKPRSRKLPAGLVDALSLNWHLRNSDGFTRRHASGARPSRDRLGSKRLPTDVDDAPATRHQRRP